MLEHDPSVPRSDGLRGDHELPLAECEGLSAHVERDARPEQQADDDRERRRTRLPERGEDEEEEDRRDRVERGHEPGEEIVDATTHVARGEAHDHADGEAHERGDETDGERNAPAVEEAYHLAPADLI